MQLSAWNKWCVLLSALLCLLCLLPSASNAQIEHTNAPLQGTLRTVRTLVPYKDLGALLEERAAKYLVLPLSEYEKLRAAKEAWLASASMAQQPQDEDLPPVKFRFASARIEGKLEGEFADLTIDYIIESFSKDWQEIALLYGPVVLTSALLNEKEVTLKSDLESPEKRILRFGRNTNAMISSRRASNEALRQEHWREITYLLPLNSPGRHRCRLNVRVPIEKADDLSQMEFRIPQIPLTFVRFEVPNAVVAVEESSLRDYRVETAAGDAERGCFVTGWLGASPYVRLQWRPRISKPVEQPAPEVVEIKSPEPTQATSAVSLEPKKPIKAPAKPLIYARTETLITLGETGLQGRMDVEYSITKAPVSSFTILLPNTVNILGVTADRPQNQQIIQEGGQKRLIIDFTTGREDACTLSVAFESRLDDAIGEIEIPEVYPINVEREMGVLAVQALSSVEVQPSKFNRSKVYQLAPAQLPETLLQKTTRPVLAAYRISARPADLSINVKRYADTPQQTVVADVMDIKTAFTTNQSCQTLLIMQIRNNNKQYMTLQLASGAKVLSAFRNSKPIEIVEGRDGGKVQVPLLMSQSAAAPAEMNLRLLIQDSVPPMHATGRLAFKAPLVDIPISHVSWLLYAPVNYSLYGFKGSVRSTIPTQDPHLFRGFLKVYEFLYAAATDPTALFLAVIILLCISIFLARNMLLNLLKGIWDAIIAVFSWIFSGSGFRLVELMIVALVIATLAAIATPNFRKAREQSTVKACYANQRVLLGAVEMYNMDNEGLMRELEIDKLVKGGYLKGNITLHEPGCAYKITGDLTQKGRIYCVKHGAVDGDDSEIFNAQQHADAYKAQPSKAPADEARQLTEGAQALAVPFGGAKAVANLPIDIKFTTTPNFYQFERDLTIAEASGSKLIANSTCPRFKARYMRWEILLCMKIAAFVLGLFAGLYFVAGAWEGSTAKFVAAAALLVITSVWDRMFYETGDLANTGLWLAILGGIIWKIIIFLSTLSPSEPEDPKPQPNKTLPKANFEGVNNPPPAADSGINVTTTMLALALGLGLLFAAGGKASAAPIPPADRQEIRIMIPFSDLSKVVETSEQVIILPESDYRYLLDVGTTTIVTSAPISAPMDYLLRSADYSGKIEEKGARFTCTFDMEILNPGWKSIPLLYNEVIPSKASFDGEPIALEILNMPDSTAKYGISTNATGSHKVSLEFFVSVKSSEFGSKAFEFSMIPSAINHFRFETPDTDAVAVIDPGVLLETATSSQGTVFSAQVPPVQKVKFEIYRKISATQTKLEPQQPLETPEIASAAPVTASPTIRQAVIVEETRITLRENNFIFFEEGLVKGRNSYTLDVTGSSGIATFGFLVPPQIRILKVSDKCVEDWAVEEVEGQKMQRLKVAFNSQMHGRFGFVVEFEELLPDFQEKPYQIPQILPMQADRVFGMIGIGCLPSLAVSVEETPSGYGIIDASAFLREFTGIPPEKMPYAFTFSSHGAASLKVRVSRPRNIEQRSAVIDTAEAMSLLNEDGWLLTRVIYEVKNNSEQFLKLQLPVIYGRKAELWSSEVAGTAVKAGYDDEHKVFNIPIIRSPLVNQQAQAFLVEIIYAVKLAVPPKPITKVRLELPRVHLAVSELTWVVYLPEGYELMRGGGNVDRLMTIPKQPLLNGEKYFGITAGYIQSSNSNSDALSESDFGIMGLLPVKFRIPTTNWAVGFSMQQIEPTREPPYIERTMVTPRRGAGKLFAWAMILLGGLGGFTLLTLLAGKRPMLSIVVLAIVASITAAAIALKLYQADHAFKMGFLAVFITGLLYELFAWRQTAPAHDE